MGKIVDRGREFVGAVDDPEGDGSILTWKIWYVMDSGRRYVTLIEIHLPPSAGLPSDWTQEELDAYADQLNADNQAQLDGAQEFFERMGPTLKLPGEGPWDPDKKEHLVGDDRVNALKEAVAQARKELGECWERYWPAHAEYHARESHGRPGGAGMCRAESHPGTDLPDCTILQQKLARLEEELARARESRPAPPEP